jgi:hypothetical protein
VIVPGPGGAQHSQDGVEQPATAVVIISSAIADTGANRPVRAGPRLPVTDEQGA